MQIGWFQVDVSGAAGKMWRDPQFWYAVLVTTNPICLALIKFVRMNKKARPC